ncbi:MAG: hydrogenase maturation protease [Calditrichia bacterium]
MKSTLVLGIGNLLMGDEGIGVHIVREMEKENNVSADILDGGTGGFHLLGYFQQYRRVILVDATIDGKPAGTVSVIYPRYSSDYPPTLTAHDIGLKDLLDALYLLNSQPEIILIAVSIEKPEGLATSLSPKIRKAVAPAMREIKNHLNKFSTGHE